MDLTCSRTHLGQVKTMPRSEEDVDQPRGISSRGPSAIAPQTTHVTAIGPAGYVPG